MAPLPDIPTPDQEETSEDGSGELESKCQMPTRQLNGFIKESLYSR